MADGPTDNFKVDLVKYGALRDEHLQVYQNGQNLTVIHVPTGLSVEADTRATADGNWELAQEALQQGIEHKEASYTGHETQKDV